MQPSYPTPMCLCLLSTLDYSYCSWISVFETPFFRRCLSLTAAASLVSEHKITHSAGLLFLDLQQTGSPVSPEFTATNRIVSVSGCRCQHRFCEPRRRLVLT